MAEVGKKVRAWKERGRSHPALGSDFARTALDGQAVHLESLKLPQAMWLSGGCNEMLIIEVACGHFFYRSPGVQRETFIRSHMYVMPRVKEVKSET